MIWSDHSFVLIISLTETVEDRADFQHLRYWWWTVCTYPLIVGLYKKSFKWGVEDITCLYWKLNWLAHWAIRLPYDIHHFDHPSHGFELLILDCIPGVGLTPPLYHLVFFLKFQLRILPKNILIKAILRQIMDTMLTWLVPIYLCIYHYNIFITWKTLLRKAGL